MFQSGDGLVGGEAELAGQLGWQIVSSIEEVAILDDSAGVVGRQSLINHAFEGKVFSVGIDFFDLVCELDVVVGL